MPLIPNVINNVVTKFAKSVNKDITNTMLAGLFYCIKHDIVVGHTLSEIYISSARDGKHSPNSRHNIGKAVDISRINGDKMILSYGDDPVVTAIVQAIQSKFEEYVKRRENFGPFLKLKNGLSYPIPNHHDHIHLSVE